MALVNLKDILTDARTNKYAVGAFNVVNLEFLEAILEAAVNKASPVILNIAEVHFKYVNIENITPAIINVAQRVEVPVTLNLDHGESLEAIMRAIRCGFTSIMFDGSKLPFEENIEKTTEVVKMCHSIGVSVEAELGHVGSAEASEEGSGDSDTSVYTDVNQAEEFVRRTRVDALAVAIGTAHGLYRGKPKLDFERLAQINERVGIPLVLHGGTGLSDEDFKKSISLGIAKINFFTGMSVNACDKVRKILENDPKFNNYPQLLKEGKDAIRKTVEEQMDIFMSSHICEKLNTLCPVCSGCIIKKEPGEKRIDKTELAKIITQVTLDVLSKS